jgi:hypothetical protein
MSFYYSIRFLNLGIQQDYTILDLPWVRIYTGYLYIAAVRGKKECKAGEALPTIPKEFFPYFQAD